MKYNNIIYSQREPNYTDLWIKPDNSLHMFNNGAWKQIAGKVDIPKEYVNTTNYDEKTSYPGETSSSFYKLRKINNDLGIHIDSNSPTNILKIGGGLGDTLYADYFNHLFPTYKGPCLPILEANEEENKTKIIGGLALNSILEEFKTKYIYIGKASDNNNSIIPMYRGIYEDNEATGLLINSTNTATSMPATMNNSGNSPVTLNRSKSDCMSLGLSVYVFPSNSSLTINDVNVNTDYKYNIPTGETLGYILDNYKTDFITKSKLSTLNASNGVKIALDLNGNLTFITSTCLTTQPTNKNDSVYISSDNNTLKLTYSNVPNNVNYDELNTSYYNNLVTGSSLYHVLENYKNEVSNIPVITADNIEGSGFNLTDKHKLDAIPNTIISNITGNTDAPGEGFTLNITGTSIASDNIGRETESSITIPVASSSADGLLSSHDKGIIDAIPGTIVSKIINEKVNEELRISLTTRDINDGAWSARTEDIIIPYGQSTYNIGVINRDTDLVANETGVIYTNSMPISSETVDINQYNNILVKLTVPEGTLPVVCNLSGIGMTKRIFKSPDLYLNYGGVETRADLTITSTINGAENIADFELVYYSGTGS